jgi:rare lipoprotein A (peptidoglycan hydrolase)
LDHVEGIASWYGTGEDECLGCNPRRIMANGQRLDDDKKTAACSVGGTCKTFPVGSRVRILNLENKMLTTALITDTGGLLKGTDKERSIDVSKAVKDAINCGGLCEVRVTVLKESKK